MAKRLRPCRRDVPLSLISPGHYSGNGLTLTRITLDSTGDTRWQLTGPPESNFQKMVTVRARAMELAEQWLDTNSPDWRKVTRRHNPVKG